MPNPEFEAQVAQTLAFYEALDAERFKGKCPGCGGKAGQGPQGCCEKCWKDHGQKRRISD